MIVMRRVWRALLGWATAVSAVLFVSVGGLWVRSQFRSDVIQYGNESATGAPGDSDEAVEARRPQWASGMWFDDWTLLTERRGFVLDHNWADSAPASVDGQFGLDLRGWTHRADEPDDSSVRLWPTFEHTGTSGPHDSYGNWTVIVPFWLTTALFGAGPILTGARVLRRRQRSRAGRCRRCGYDLRATPDRCPECGAAASKGCTSAAAACPVGAAAKTG